MSSEPPTRKLRLAVIGATYAFVETRKKIQALAEHFDVVCITCESYTCYGLANRVADQPPPEGYRLVALPAIGEPVTTTRYLLAGLAEAIRRHPVDVILVESEPWAWVRWQAWLGRMLWQRGVLFGEFSWENVRRRGWKGSILSGAYRAAVATADFVITGNRDAGDIFRDHGLAPDRLLVSPQLGVDEALYRLPDAAERACRRAEMDCRDGDFLVGFCGRMEEEKGVLDLVQAVQRLRQQIPRTPDGGEVRLALLGPDGRLTPRLTSLQEGNPWLRLYPARPHVGIVDFMHALDLFVLPSREMVPPTASWKEQFGHVLIEATACGTPTLGADSGAIPEVLEGSGMVYPWRRPEALVTRLRELVEMPAGELAAIARSQREHTLSRYTHHRIAAVWADFLRTQAEASKTR